MNKEERERIQRRIDGNQKTLDQSTSLTLDYNLVKAKEEIDLLKWVLKGDKQSGKI